MFISDGYSGSTHKYLSSNNMSLKMLAHFGCWWGHLIVAIDKVFLVLKDY